MTNAKVFKVIGIVLLIVGIVTFVLGISRWNEANSMIDTAIAGADLFGYSQNTYKTVSSWSSHAETAKGVIIAGSIIFALGLVFFAVGFFQGNAIKHPESAQVEKQATLAASSDVKERLRAIEELRNDGLLSEDEYIERRKQIIEKL